MKLTYCQQHPNQEVLLVCLQPSCTSKLLCLHCTNQHYRHDIVSLQHFATQIVAPLQRNRNNPHRTQIVKQLNAVMQSMVNKLHQARNKINALIGDCEDKLQQYFGKLLSSFSVPSQQYIKQQIDNSLSSALIAGLLSQVAKVQKMVMGTFQETNMLTYHTKQLFQQKMNEMLTTSSQAINSLKAFMLQISFAKPEKYELSFNRQKMQKGSFIVSDEGLSLQRVIGNGGFPLCLSASPFSPLHTRFSIKIQKTANNRSICMGACLQNVVRNNSFTNCCGFGKGIYAIDQNSPYSSGTMMASWNHHDTHFNQTHVGSNDLVGWTFHQGDTLTLSLDYYNSVLAFIKPTEGQDEEVLLYQMPIKLDAGPIYPFVSMANKGDVVSIVEVQEVD